MTTTREAQLETLMPCPFCGMKPWHAQPSVRVVCKCGAAGEWGSDYADAAAKWNTRAALAARPAPQPAADTPAPMYVGIDLAAKGGDETVVVIRNPTAAMLDAIRSADQPAADTRVVAEQLKAISLTLAHITGRDTADEVALDSLAAEIRAIRAIIDGGQDRG